MWLGLVALMTMHGFSGNERYVMAPVGLMCVLAGAGAAAGADVVRRLVRTGQALGLGIAALAVVAALAGSVPYVARPPDGVSRL